MKHHRHEKVSKKSSYSEVMTSSLLNQKEILNSPINSNQISNGYKNNTLEYRWLNYDSLQRRNAVVGNWSKDDANYKQWKGKKNLARSHSDKRTEFPPSFNLRGTKTTDEIEFVVPVNNISGEITIDLSEVTMKYTHWAEWVPNEVLQALNKQEVKLQEAIWEFILTESTFLTNMKIVQDIFVPQLNLLKKRNLVDIHPQNIFGGISEIYQAHLKFWKQCPEKCMKEAARKKSLLSEGKVVEYFPDDFEENFEEYLSHCLFAAKYQEQLMNVEDNLAFKEYLNWCKNHKYSQKKELGSFLIEPMQHMMRYALLINAIKTHCPSPDTKMEFVKISEKLQSFLAEIDSRLREQEEMEIVQQINNRIEMSIHIEQNGHEDKFLSKFYKFDLLAPMPSLPFSMARILFKYSKLKMRDMTYRLSSLRNAFGQENSTGFSPVNIYLFTDIILIARETKRNTISLLKHPILLDSVIIEKRPHNQFFLISQSEFNMPTEILCFKSGNSQVIDSWMEAIKRASDEFISAKRDFVSESYFRQHMVDIKRRNFNSLDYCTDNTPIPSRKNSERNGKFEISSEDSSIEDSEIFPNPVANQENSNQIISDINGIEETKVHQKNELSESCKVEQKIDLNVQITPSCAKVKLEEKPNGKKQRKVKLKRQYIPPNKYGTFIFPPGRFPFI